MTSGRALTYVQPETASQILCQIIGKDRWERLFGGRVGRHAAGAPGTQCLIASDQVTLTLSMHRSDTAFTGHTTVAGRPATISRDSEGNEVFRLALTDEALRPATHQYRGTQSLIELRAIGGKPEYATTWSDLARRVLNEVVPLLAKEGDPLPDIDDQGRVRYVITPLTAGGEIVDLPMPVQALQLCTLLREEPAVQVQPTEMELRDSGACRVGTKDSDIELSMDDATKDSAYPQEIAGRPARRLTDSQVLNVRLRDDAQVELRVSAPDAAVLAGKLVPLLLKR